MNGDNPLVLFCVFVKDYPRIIGRSIINSEYGEVFIGLGKHRIQTLAKILGNIVNRNDYGYTWLFTGVLSK